MNFISRLIIATAMALNSFSYVQASTEIVVLTPPGGVNDIVGRSVTEYLRTQGVDAVVVYKPGGDGAVGANYTLNSKNDALVIANAGTFIFNHISKKKLSYSPDDFELIAPMATVPASLVVSNKIGAKSIEEFVQIARTRPLNCGVANQGTMLALRMFFSHLQIDRDIQIISYKGTSQIISDLIGGQIDCTLDPVSSYVKLHEGGKLTIIGVAEDRPNEQIKNFPMMSRYMPGFKYQSWFGVAVPIGMPREKQIYYLGLLSRITEDPEFNRAITTGGMLVSRIGIDSRKWYREEYSRWENARKNLKIEKTD